MIHGVVASTAFAPSTFAPPVDSFIYLDFMEAQYWISGVETALSSLFDRSDFVVAGSGALFDWNTADVPANMSSTLLSAINGSGGSFTIVCDWKRLEAGYNDVPLFIDTGISTYYIEFDQDLSGAGELYVTAKLSASMWPYVLSTTPPPGVGNVARAALRYDQSNGIALAVNGTLVGSLSGTASPLLTFASGAIGGYPGETWLATNSYIRKIEFYSVKSDAELTALSVP